MRKLGRVSGDLNTTVVSKSEGAELSESEKKLKQKLLSSKTVFPKIKVYKDIFADSADYADYRIIILTYI